MGALVTLLIIVFSVASVLIIVVVLLQDEQGEGFGGLFGGGNSSMPFGSSGGNILVRISSFLGVIFLISSIAVALTFKTGDAGLGDVISESHQLEGENTNWFLDESEEVSNVETETESEQVTGEEVQ